MGVSRRFRVALSFAGEMRDYVAKVASLLASHFGEPAILYDKYHEAELARRDLAFHLPELYRSHADLVVVILCPDYEGKEWCGLEWDAIFDVLKQRRDEDVMLCRFGRATVRGLFSTAGFVDLDGKSEVEGAACILERLALNEGKERDYYLSAEQATAACAHGGIGIAPTGPQPHASLGVMQVDPWHPAVPPCFVGRRVLLGKLRGAWDQGRSVSIVGDWRIGKSSVLATCYETLRNGSRPVRLLNGARHEGASPADFVKAATGTDSVDESDGAADVLAGWARREQRQGLLPLLLVDEFDALVRRFEYRFFERLRGMLDELCLGVSSRRELDRVFTEAGRHASPFQNRLELHWVGLLEPEAAEALAASAGSALSYEARRSILEWAGRHPFFIQLMTRKLQDALEFGQSREQAEEEFQAEASARLRELWGTLTEKERQILLESVETPKPSATVLRRRGLLDETGRPFGRVLTTWLTSEAL